VKFKFRFNKFKFKLNQVVQVQVQEARRKPTNNQKIRKVSPRNSETLAHSALIKINIKKLEKNENMKT